MPTVYTRTEHIQELNGELRDGLTVVAHTPTDVLDLEGLVDTVGRLPGDTLDNLYRVLVNAGRSPEIWPGFARRGDTGGNHVGLSDAFPEYLGRRARALKASLSIGRELWAAQGKDVEQLSLALMLPRPGRRASLRTKRPALVLDYGSIRARVLTAGGKLKRFGVALFPVARSKRRANVVEALRDHATGRRLMRIEAVQPSDLENKTGIVVFLHGLMSTDAGTFDEFVRELEVPANFGDALLVSWPHDTLAPIEANAEDLSVIIEQRLGQSSLPIAFVCHSRGGLVARRTAVELIEIDRRRWASRLRGLVTFGTPHQGAELAEAGDEFLGKLLVAYTVVRQGGGLVPLVDALWAVKDHKKLAGITDLRPRSNGGDFLRDLRKAEGRIAKKAGSVPLRLFAIGGDIQTSGLAASLSRRYFGGAAHDLIVTLESSTPAAAERRAKVDCDHFGYFSATEVGGVATSEAIEFLRQSMALPGVQASPASEAQPQLPTTGRPVKVDSPAAKRPRPPLPQIVAT